MDFIYFYVGAFVGGGLVLNGGLFAGRTGNAAALGSMPVPDGAGGTRAADRPGLARGARAQPARRRAAARRALRSDRRLGAASAPTSTAGSRPRPRGIAYAIAAAAAIIDFEAAVIDGAFPAGRAGPAARRGRRRAAPARPLRHRPAGAAARHASARSPARSAAPACRSSTATCSTSILSPVAAADLTMRRTAARRTLSGCRPWRKFDAWGEPAEDAAGRRGGVPRITRHRTSPREPASPSDR